MAEPKKKPAARAKVIDLERVTRIAEEITQMADGHLTDLTHRLETEEKLKLGPHKSGNGLWIASMHGITATATSGARGALNNWANAARRAALKGGAA